MIVKDYAVSLAVAGEVSPVTRIRGTLAAPDGLCNRPHFHSLFSHWQRPHFAAPTGLSSFNYGVFFSKQLGAEL